MFSKGEEMVSVEFILEDPQMPRTIFWERTLAILHAIPQSGGSRIHIPGEDVAMETNWPRYANMGSAYVRGLGHDLSASGVVIRYYTQLADWAHRHPHETILMINMHPFIRIPRMLRGISNLYIADGCLSELDRSVNPRCISMPALPIQTSDQDYTAEGRRKYLASFQGVLSHPVRASLGQFHEHQKIPIRIIEKARHATLQLDAISGRADEDYRDLMENADFAFIPRGDALFSYRLLEAMSFGSIPIVLADNWVLPFDRLIDWSSCALRPREDEIGTCIELIKTLSDAEVFQRKQKVLEVYRQHFASLEQILVRGLLTELEKCRTRVS